MLLYLELYFYFLSKHSDGSVYVLEDLTPSNHPLLSFFGKHREASTVTVGFNTVEDGTPSNHPLRFLARIVYASLPGYISRYSTAGLML